MSRWSQPAGISRQQAVSKLCKEHGYTTDLRLLTLGLCEEAGEVAAAVLDISEGYVKDPGRSPSNLEHELNDVLTYLCAIANVAKIDLRI